MAGGGDERTLSAATIASYTCILNNGSVAAIAAYSCQANRTPLGSGTSGKCIAGSFTAQVTASAA